MKRMKEATEQLAFDFQQATAVDHHGLRGSRREASVAKFLGTRLPRDHAVDTNGISFDAHDMQSRELDILIYRAGDTPFLLPDDPPLVPSESLLAAVEVKSVLDRDEIRDCLEVAHSIRQLRPFGKRFADARARGQSADDGLPRCLFSIFAFDTDLVPGDDWMQREAARFADVTKSMSIPLQHVDRLVIMDRGIINCAHGVGHDSVKSGRAAVQFWFVHLVNHLLREDRRRPEIDIDIYTGRERWARLPGWETSGKPEVQSGQIEGKKRGSAARRHTAT
jgi:hypothetical protein